MVLTHIWEQNLNFGETYTVLQMATKMGEKSLGQQNHPDVLPLLFKL